MHTFFGTRLADLRGRRQRRSKLGVRSSTSPLSRFFTRQQHPGGNRTPDLRADDGFLLIEVIISALLVALIVVATFNGFDAVTRLTADQRNHSEGALLAAQSQEELRTDAATALDTLESTPHAFPVTANGTTYTITQEAKPVSAKENNTGCVATETTQENGANIEIVSSVTWPQLTKAGRPAVKQASIITPPVGSALEVDVTNGAAPPAGVKGITALAKFVPEGSGSYTSAEGTTGSAGCVVLTGLATTLATVEIAERINFVTTGDALKYPTKEVTIAPNITTQYPVTYAEAGKIRAEFTYEGNPVTSDTFVASNTSIAAGYTPYEVGSTAFTYSGGAEEEYTTGTGKYETKASTATGPKKYPKGSLFPFSTAWIVYAGDCPANKVSTVSATIKEGEEQVVKVPMSRTELTIYKGNDAKNSVGTITEALGPVKISNTGCESYAVPDDATARNVTHEQEKTESTKGRLKNPYQPFGAYKLCVYDSALKRTFTVSGTNSKVEGTKPNIYIGQRTARDRENLITQWKKEEAESKLKNSERIKKEETLKTEETEENANGVTVEEKPSC